MSVTVKRQTDIGSRQMRRVFRVQRLAGRCADGAERDGGRRYHATEVSSDGQHAWEALCGAKPGRRSAGWSSTFGAVVTCPRCLARLKRAGTVLRFVHEGGATYRTYTNQVEAAGVLAHARQAGDDVEVVK